MRTGTKANTSTTLPEHPERATLEGKNKVFGLWLFLGGEVLLFASFIGAYLALKGNINNGPGPAELFHLELVFIMTAVLLTSSVTSVLAVWAMQRNDYRKTQRWFAATVALGLIFLGFEIYEFVEYYQAGLGFSTSAFASSFYSLVGLHGAHVVFGISWIVGLLVQARKDKINLAMAPKLYAASLYWHFIDVVWVFIFTIVYLLGIAGAV